MEIPRTVGLFKANEDFVDEGCGVEAGDAFLRGRDENRMEQDRG